MIIIGRKITIFMNCILKIHLYLEQNILNSVRLRLQKNSMNHAVSTFIISIQKYEVINNYLFSCLRSYERININNEIIFHEVNF